MYLGKVVEQAPTGMLWAQPLHPYTSALIAAIPHADGSGLLPEALAGEVPDPVRPPSGCRFHPRCPVALARCAHDVPVFERLPAERDVACWLRGSEASADDPIGARQAERLA
jgi:peptide/nickel transport system ATP-binding protein